MLLRYALPTLLLFSSHLINAQAGALDLSFGVEGVAFASHDGSDQVTAMVVLPDDAIVVAGYAYFSGAVVLAKFTPDGLPFPGFGTDGVALIEFAPEKVYACGIDAQPNGKLLVGGYVWDKDGSERTSFLARLHANGSRDTSFGINGVVEFGLDGWATRSEAMALQPDGKVLFTGKVAMGGTQFAFVARLNADGSMDSGFGEDGIRTIYLGTLDQSGWAVTPLPESRTLVACAAAEPGGFNGIVLVRFNENGIEDTSFGNDGYVYDPILDATKADVPKVLLPLPGGNFLLACRARTPDGSRMGLLAYDSSGERIPAFATDGILVLDYGNASGAGDVPYALIPDAQGRVTMIGTLYTFEEGVAIGLARILPSGELDDTFGDGGLVYDEDGQRLTAVAAGEQADGSLIVAGLGYDWDNLNGSDHAVSRYLSGTVGIHELSNAIDQVQVFPNPVADRFVLSFEHHSIASLRIELLDMQGRIIHRFAQRAFLQGEQRLELNWPADAVAGVYTIAIVSVPGTAYVKVLR